MLNRNPENKMINRLLKLITPKDIPSNGRYLSKTVDKIRSERNAVEVEFDFLGDDISDSDTMPLNSKFHHKYSKK